MRTGRALAAAVLAVAVALAAAGRGMAATAATYAGDRRRTSTGGTTGTGPRSTGSHPRVAPPVALDPAHAVDPPGRRVPG